MQCAAINELGEEVGRFVLEGVEPTITMTFAHRTTIVRVDQVIDESRNGPIRCWTLPSPRTLLPGDTLAMKFHGVTCTIADTADEMMRAVRQYLDPSHQLDDLALYERAATYFANAMYKGA